MPKRPKAVSLAALRARIRVLEAAPAGPGEAEAVAFGAAAIDAALPWGGLPRAALHEVVAAAPGEAAAAGFCAALLARLAEGRGPALWCLARGDLHGPGLGAFGLAPDRLIVVRARRPVEVLWAMEEGLRSGRLGAVLGEARAVDLTAGRRLQLAAKAGGTPCLALLAPAAGRAPGAALTRWRVAAAPSAPEDGLPGLGRARWRVELLRCRGGAPCTWLVEWNDEARRFAVVSVLAERAPGAAVPARRRAG